MTSTGEELSEHNALQWQKGLEPVRDLAFSESEVECDTTRVRVPCNQFAIAGSLRHGWFPSCTLCPTFYPERRRARTLETRIHIEDWIKFVVMQLQEPNKVRTA